MGFETWREALLPDVVYFQEGPGLRNWQYRDEGIPFVNIRCLKDGRLMRSEMTCLDPGEVETKYKHFLLDVGDYVVSSSGTLGRLAEVFPEDLPCMLNTSVIRFRPLDEGVLDRRFLKAYLRSDLFHSQIRTHASGSAQLNYGPTHLKQMTLPIPPIEEQRAIGQLLGVLDDRIDNLRQTNATLEAIAQALFKSWFVDFDPVRAKAEGREPEGMDRATAALFPSEFEDSELGPIPKGWRAGSLGDIVELKYGKALKSSDRRAGPFPVYGSGGVTGTHDAFLVDHPSVIVGRKGTVGSLYWQDTPFFPIDTVFYVLPKVSLHFCYHAMKCMGLDHLNTDAVVPGLNRENAYRQPVVIPADGLLPTWDAIAGSFRARISHNNMQIEKLAELRDTLLPRLISGRLRPPRNRDWKNCLYTCQAEANSSAVTPYGEMF